MSTLKSCPDCAERGLVYDEITKRPQICYNCAGLGFVKDNPLPEYGYDYIDLTRDDA
jgi:hypothetical protein